MLKHRASKVLAWTMVALVAIPYLASGASAAALTAESSVKTVLFFPLDSSADKSNAQVASDLTNYIENGLLADNRYSVVRYSDRLAPVQRLIKEHPELKGSSTVQYTSDTAAIKRAQLIGQAMGVDLILVGSVDNYAVSADGSAEIRSTVMIIDAVTGKNLRTVALTGRNVKPVGIQSAVIEDPTTGAMRDAGRQIVFAVTGKTYASSTDPEIGIIKNSGTKKNSWLTVLLVAAAAGLLFGGGGSGGSGLDTPGGPPF